MKSNKITKNKKYRIVKCVPFLLCPKCHGEGSIPSKNQNNTSTLPLMEMCNLCNGAMVIPYAVIPKKK